jgi:L-lactate dehydrogenase complex protein LldG
MTMTDGTPGGTAREAVLSQIRAALGTEPPGVISVPRDYQRRTPDEVALVARFAERVSDYRAEVHQVASADVGRVVGRALAERHARRVVVPPDLPAAWRTGDHEWVTDRPDLDHASLDAIDAVVTGCAIAIAETGTIVLDAGPAQGRRVITLLPDAHVCVVAADQIVGDVPEALERLDPRRPLTWISGPSATSDIELNRIEGVHGPRTLIVIIVAH